MRPVLEATWPQHACSMTRTSVIPQRRSLAQTWWWLLEMDLSYMKNGPKGSQLCGVVSKDTQSYTSHNTQSSAAAARSPMISSCFAFSCSSPSCLLSSALGSFIFMIHKQQDVLHMIIIIYVNYNIIMIIRIHIYIYIYICLLSNYNRITLLCGCVTAKQSSKKESQSKKRESVSPRLWEVCFAWRKITARYLFDLSLESINGFSRVMQKLCPPFQKARVKCCFQRPFGLSGLMQGKLLIWK